MNMHDINDLLLLHNKDKGKRIAQIELARKIITKTRSEKEYTEAKRISELIFDNSFLDRKKKDFKILVKSPIFKGSVNVNITIDQLLVNKGIAASLSDGRRLIKSKGIKINGVIINNPQETINNLKPYFGEFYIINKGKKMISLLKKSMI